MPYSLMFDPLTGSTTGIGEAIARRCVAEGARVLVHGRNERRGRAVTEELGGAAVLHVDEQEIVTGGLGNTRHVTGACDADIHTQRDLARRHQSLDRVFVRRHRYAT